MSVPGPAARSGSVRSAVSVPNGSVRTRFGSVRFGSRKPESPKHTEALMFWTLLICFDFPKLFLEARFPGLDPPNVQVSRFPGLDLPKRAGFQVWTPQNVQVSRFGPPKTCRFPGLDPPKRAGFQVWTPQTQTLSFGLGTLNQGLWFSLCQG